MSTDAMDLDTRTIPQLKKPQTLTQLTISSPPFSYIHLSTPSLPSSTSPSTAHTTIPLDNLQLRSYLTSALRQFLGETGVAIQIDVLKVSPKSAWVRIPRQDLGAFVAAITAFPGITQGRTTLLLQINACGDFLGSLLGRGAVGGGDGEEQEWDVWKS
ncbi:hypothetical protein QBC43DRAFT_316979 [Cladorrhinum sp. PSN259]|nr:hypothetical protein QBC43DRAFT_316979 [Cladorrhinum sp. PSN259]